MILAAATRLIEAMLTARACIGGASPLRDRLVLGQRSLLPAEIWIHAASVGEVNSAATLIEELARTHTVLVTTNSETGLARARSMGWQAALAPLDVPGAVGRFLDAVRPRVAVTVEAELWPTRAKALAARGIPHVVVGARMSERSARRWLRLPGLIKPVLRNVTGLSAQDEGSEARLLALGLPKSALLPRLDLKLLAPAQIIAPLKGAKPDAARDRTVLAASTHAGEDEPILDACLAARRVWPDLRLLLAPRHPDRGDALAALMEQRGIAFARRSEGADDAPLLLADTLGEMSRWYSRAGICITGGSLVDHGGHTPWEPAAHACAILHGPHVANFAESYAALDQAGAARLAGTAELPAALAELLNSPATAQAMGQAARALLDRRAGDPGALLAWIGDLVQSGADADMMDKVQGKSA